MHIHFLSAVEYDESLVEQWRIQITLVSTPVSVLRHHYLTYYVIFSIELHVVKF